MRLVREQMEDGEWEVLYSDDGAKLLEAKSVGKYDVLAAPVGTSDEDRQRYYKELQRLRTAS